MKYTNEQLQDVLNYDSNGTKFFSDFERMAIHKAISYRLTYGASLEIERILSAKISNTLNKMRTENYTTIDVRYIEDHNGNKTLKQ